MRASVTSTISKAFKRPAVTSAARSPAVLQVKSSGVGASSIKTGAGSISSASWNSSTSLAWRRINCRLNATPSVHPCSNGIPSACALASTSRSILCRWRLLIRLSGLDRNLRVAFARLRLDLPSGLRCMDRTYPLDDEFLGKVTGDMATANSAQHRRLTLAIAGADRAAAVKAADIRIGVDGAPRFALEPQPFGRCPGEPRHRGH